MLDSDSEYTAYYYVCILGSGYTVLIDLNF